MPGAWCPLSRHLHRAVAGRLRRSEPAAFGADQLCPARERSGASCPLSRRHEFGTAAAIPLLRPGAVTRVRSWTPTEGSYHGFLIPHGESISIADYLTVRDGGTVRHRPTCHYAYHPCDDAVLSLHEFAGKNFQLQQRKRLMMEEIAEGIDELGVLLMGQANGVYWYGSRRSIAEGPPGAAPKKCSPLPGNPAEVAGKTWGNDAPRL